MPNIQLGQHLLAFVTWKDDEGKPIEPVENELPIWYTTKPNVLSCNPSKENPGAASLQGIKLGDSELTATANFDTGYGIHQSSVMIPISVVQYVTPTGEIELSYGSIGPVG